MRWLVFGIVLLVILGVITVQATFPASSITLNPFTTEMNDYGPAPELTNTVWLNTDAPLRLADLRGKVVAIDMWTFG